MRLKLILVSLCLLFTPSLAQASLTFPDRGTAVVVDTAHVFSPEMTKTLGVKLTAWEKKTHHQLVVVTVPNLQGTSISDYGYQLGRKWKLGRTGADDSIILLRAQAEKQTRIEVGRGMEVALTDAASKSLLHEAIVPAIRAEGVEQGLYIGADSIMRYVDAHESDVKKAHAPARANLTGVWIVMAALWTVLLVGIYFVVRKAKQMERERNQRTTPKTSFSYGSYAQQNSRAQERMNNTPSSNGGMNYSSNYSPPSDDWVAPVVAASMLSDSNDDDNRRGISSSDDTPDIGFTSDNSDNDSFAGGGADESD